MILSSARDQEDPKSTRIFMTSLNWSTKSSTADWIRKSWTSA